MATADIIRMVEYVANQARKQEEDMQAAKKVSGDGGNGMEARMAKLEAFAESTDRRLSLIEQDLRGLANSTDSKFQGLSAKVDRHFVILISAIAGSFVIQLGFFATLLGVMAKGFGWLK
jgi:hypothetical protein